MLITGRRIGRGESSSDAVNGLEITRLVGVMSVVTKEDDSVKVGRTEVDSYEDDGEASSNVDGVGALDSSEEGREEGVADNESVRDGNRGSSAYTLDELDRELIDGTWEAEGTKTLLRSSP